jgi:hypothetical protein
VENTLARRSEARPCQGTAKDEKAGENDQESSQMMIEFTFFLVGQELALI